MKKLLLITALVAPIGLFGMDVPASSKQAVQPFTYEALLAQGLDPNRTALLWDMSGVLLGRNKKAAAAHVLGTPWATIMFFSYIKPELDKLECAEEWVEEMSKECAKKSWLTANKDSWKQFLNTLVTISQTPDKDTIKLFEKAIQQVTEGNLGYTGIFSNNGPTAFKIQKARDGFGFLKKANIVTCEKNAQAKPKTAAYTMAKAAVLKANPAIKSFILIDDNLQNVKGAQENGIYGIFYSNKDTDKDGNRVTTAQDLAKKLIALGLLAKQAPEEKATATKTSE